MNKKDHQFNGVTGQTNVERHWHELKAQSSFRTKQKIQMAK